MRGTPTEGTDRHTLDSSRSQVKTLQDRDATSRFPKEKWPS